MYSQHCGGRKQVTEEFKAILGYVESLEVAWATRDPVSKQTSKQTVYLVLLRLNVTHVPKLLIRPLNV